MTIHEIQRSWMLTCSMPLSSKNSMKCSRDMNPEGLHVGEEEKEDDDGMV